MNIRDESDTHSSSATGNNQVDPRKISESRLPWRMSLIWAAAMVAFVITGLALAHLLNL
jgi:hypothetical protein